MSQNIRLHYLDNLRALAMLLGIVFHCALAYSPLMQNVWLTSDSQNSVIIDVFAYCLHLFRMPLFFVVSGYFALMLIDKRTVSGFIKNRAKRILLPFIIFLPLLSIAMMLIISWAINSISTTIPMLNYLVEEVSGSMQEMPINTMHLWFLLNLFFMCLMAAGLHKLKLFDARWFKAFSSPLTILLLLPLLMTPALMYVSAPHPAPSKVYPEVWSFGFYGIYFLLGGALYKNRLLLQQLSQYKHYLLITGIVLYIVFYYQLPASLSLLDMVREANGVPFSWHHTRLAIVEAFAALYLTLVCIILGQQYLSIENKIFKYFMDSSYWLYLIHLPILLMTQYYLIDLELNMWLKFAIGNVVVFTIGIASYQLLVRNTVIGVLLNGKRIEGMKK